ncbi:MAG: transcription antitermination factor NusB [Hyphomicrobium sp.]
MKTAKGGQTIGAARKVPAHTAQGFKDLGSKGAGGKSQQRSRSVEGAAARDAAVESISAVLKDGRAFDDALAKSSKRHDLQPRDRAFARALASAALRNRGALQAVIARFIEKPLPHGAGRLEAILLSGAAQLLVLATPPHAAISLAVDQARADPRARRFDKLTNAVLRRVSEQGAEILKGLDTVRLNVPGWMFERWRKAYGEPVALEIARASLQEAPLDLNVKSDAAGWAEKLGGTVLSTGSIRLNAGGKIEDLAGFAEGAWWVQDAAAALPVKILGNVAGLDVADLCAAPGGKTAQLAALGARVAAVDQSEERLARLSANLTRLGLTAEIFAADVTKWTPGRLFDAVLVDAPCTATGTIRRHPDILYLKRAADIGQLAVVQADILAAAARLVRPGGRMVYCTCSLEPEEGPDQVETFLARHLDFARERIDVARIGGEQGFVTQKGELRTLPHFWAGLAPGQQGMDGFYAALMVRKS